MLLSGHERRDFYERYQFKIICFLRPWAFAFPCRRRCHYNYCCLLREQKKTFEKFDDCWGEYLALGEKSVFVYAFKLGAMLAVEVMSSAKE